MVIFITVALSLRGSNFDFTSLGIKKGRMIHAAFFSIPVNNHQYLSLYPEGLIYRTFWMIFRRLEC